MGNAFDPRGALAVLERHRVNYVVIGGLARVLQGTDEVTHDVDICPSTRQENLRRLGTALTTMAARTRGGDALTPLLGADPQLEGVVDLDTRFGCVTLVAQPAGTRGYDDLRRRASREPLGGGLRAPIAGAGDLIRTLDELNRPRDAGHIAALRHVIELERSLGLQR